MESFRQMVYVETSSDLLSQNFYLLLFRSMFKIIKAKLSIGKLLLKARFKFNNAKGEAAKQIIRNNNRTTLPLIIIILRNKVSHYNLQ